MLKLFGLDRLAFGGGGVKRAELLPVRKILSGARVYRTDKPEHSFLWGAPETAQFLMDLEAVAGDRTAETDHEERHYLGNLSVSPDLETGEMQILDGLQRLTMLSMFLAFARDRLRSASVRNQIHRMLFRTAVNGERTPRVTLNSDERDWFSLYILDTGGTLDLPRSAPNPGQRRLLAAARFMHRVFADYSRPQIRRLVRAVTHETALVVGLSAPEAWSALPALPAPVEFRQPKALPAAPRTERQPDWRPTQTSGGANPTDEHRARLH